MINKSNKKIYYKKEIKALKKTKSNTNFKHKVNVLLLISVIICNLSSGSFASLESDTLHDYLKNSQNTNHSGGIDMNNFINDEVKERFLNRVAFPTLENGKQDIQGLRAVLEKSAKNSDPKLLKDINKTIKKVQLIEGNAPIELVIYEPKKRDKALPAILWIHGGGLIVGTAENDALASRFVNEAECIVVSVDYRLAPEHPYPAALEDCYLSLQWLHDNAKKFNIDTKRIAIGGASAGGGLTAAVSILARDLNGPEISFQMPLYPMLDYRMQSQSSYEIRDYGVWTRENNREGWAAYLGGPIKDLTPYVNVSKYASPALENDMKGLPPTYTCVGTLDLFRDETLEYVNKLAKAGVPVEFHLYPSLTHGFERFFSGEEIADNAYDEYVNAMISALNN